MKTLEAEISFIDENHRIAVIVFLENHDAIMLPLDLLPEGLRVNQKLIITIQTAV